MEWSKPQGEHAFLHRMVGDWKMVSTTSDANYNADDPSQCFRETIRSIGGLWIVGDSRGRMPDESPMTAVMTLGFDPKKNQFVGSWVGSMMNNMWVYKGWLEPDGKTLVLEAAGPSFDGSGEMALYHDVITLHDDNHRTFASGARQPDGTFKEFMSSEFHRVN